MCYLSNVVAQQRRERTIKVTSHIHATTCTSAVHYRTNTRSMTEGDLHGLSHTRCTYPEDTRGKQLTFHGIGTLAFAYIYLLHMYILQIIQQQGSDVFVNCNSKPSSKHIPPANPHLCLPAPCMVNIIGFVNSHIWRIEVVQGSSSC